MTLPLGAGVSPPTVSPGVANRRARLVRPSQSIVTVTGGCAAPPPAAAPPPRVPPPPPLARNPIEWARRQSCFVEQHGWPALLRKCGRTLHPRAPVAFDFTAYAQPPAFGDAYWPALRECRVCIGVNRYPSLRFPFHQPDTYSRLRDIEAPMAGACYLTELTEGLDQLYELGSEIETYRDASELVEKARALAADAPRRNRLRASGQQRALNDHSISRTIKRIAGRLNCA